MLIRMLMVKNKRRVYGSVFVLFAWLAALPVFSQENKESVSVSGYVTQGTYSDSVYRRSIKSQTMSIFYAPAPDYGLTLNVARSKVYYNPPLAPIEGTNTGISFFKYFDTGTSGYLGGKISATTIKSDDTNSDGALVYYMSVMRKPHGEDAYYDLGFSYANYKDTSASQLTLTGGMALFNWWAWSQTRIYVITQSKKIKETVAIEERFTYYAVPKKLTLTFYGILGQRVYAYDPDLGAVYNLPDTQRGSTGGVSVTLSPIKSLSLIGDITYETYENEGINNSYTVKYTTLGLQYTF